MEKGDSDTARDERTRLSVGLYQVRILPYIGAEVSDLQMPKMWSNGADGKRGRVMIPEREREALMRLTMCAREECRICMYQKRCDFNFQYELATKNMNILADALRADRKTEPTISKMEQVEDEPQTDICIYCEHYEPKGYCKLKKHSVSPNYKCDEYLKLKPYGVKIINKSYESVNGAKVIIETEPQTNADQLTQDVESVETMQTESEGE